MAFQVQPSLGDLETSSNIGALNETVVLDTNGVSGAKAVVSGTWAGTIKFEQSIDGVRWDNIGCFSGTTGAVLSATGITSNDIVVFVGIAGVSKIRARFHAYTSGTASVVIRASNGVSNVFVDNLIPANLKAQTHTHDGAGVPIGSIGDRLKVAADIIPTGKVVHATNYLLNGSSNSMSVNGSSTPVSFTYTVPGGQTWYVQNINLFMIDGGTMDPTDFGSIAGLTNGLLLEASVSGNLYTIGTYKNNVELATLFSSSSVGNSTTLFGTSGFLETSDIYLGSKVFKPEITLNAGDYIRVTVRDNLTSIDILNMSISRWRDVP